MPLLPDDFDSRRFLREYWQRRPLLIRGDGTFRDPLDVDELAGLACEPEVESRLIRNPSDTEQDWTLEQGPFEPATLSALGDRDFCLLVQAVDQWHPAARELLAAFRFLPAWRLDDIMASCSGDGGSAGPHYDQYDVFLIQGSGRKRWHIGPVCDASTPVDERTGMRLLSDFRGEQEVEAGPGDILYIPARFAHHGISLGPSLTWSVGFRAPSATEIITGVASIAADRLTPDIRYRDPSAEPPAQPGEIPASSVNELKNIINKSLQETDIIEWFGRHMTEPRYPELLQEEEDDTPLPRWLTNHSVLYKTPGSRFAFHRRGEEVLLFADGHPVSLPGQLEPILYALTDHRHERIELSQEDREQPALLDALETLYNQGSLLKEPPYEPSPTD